MGNSRDKPFLCTRILVRPGTAVNGVPETDVVVCRLDRGGYVEVVVVCSTWGHWKRMSYFVRCIGVEVVWAKPPFHADLYSLSRGFELFKATMANRECALSFQPPVAQWRK
jgi:hypothetical protein